MSANWKKDLSASAAAFQDIVWPVISIWLGGGELVPVEAVTQEGFDKELDALAGIDAWHIKRDKALIRSIASRVQWLDDRERLWNSFTIRYSRTTGTETEYSKRMKALNNPDAGWLYPWTTIQAYLRKNTNELLSVACVRTRDLYQFTTEHWDKVVMRPNHEDGNEFLAVYWRDLKSNKVPLKEYTTEQNLLPGNNGRNSHATMRG